MGCWSSLPAGSLPASSLHYIYWGMVSHWIWSSGWSTYQFMLLCLCPEYKDYKFLALPAWNIFGTRGPNSYLYFFHWAISAACMLLKYKNWDDILILFFTKTFYTGLLIKFFFFYKELSRTISRWQIIWSDEGYKQEGTGVIGGKHE